MSATVIGGFTLWQLNKTAQTYSPLLSQMESLLHSPFGLVPLSLDLQAQFDAEHGSFRLAPGRLVTCV